jgi:hypothetical protein
MNWKEFFKPTVGKIILFIVLMGGLNYLIISTIHVLDARILIGLPLGFYPKGSFYCPSTTTCVPPPVEFSWFNFIFDIIFWYLISCLIIFIYRKVKK